MSGIDVYQSNYEMPLVQKEPINHACCARIGLTSNESRNKDSPGVVPCSPTTSLATPLWAAFGHCVGLLSLCHVSASY